MFTSIEKKVLLSFLSDLSEHMGNAGCNDFSLPATVENKVFLQDVLCNQFQEGALDQQLEYLVQDFESGKLITMDILVLDYLIDKIERIL